MLPPALILLAWVPIVLNLFRFLPVQWAFVVSFVGGFLYLPQFAFVFPLLIPGTRMAFTAYSAVLGTILFNAEVRRLYSFKLNWFDLPMIVWCLCPFASSISNDLGVADGLKEMMAQIVSWGIPYLLGRIYLSDLEGLRKLALGIFVGALSYIPLCLIELRLSPIVHQRVYGFDGSGGRIGQNVSSGGYRPIVFQEHGLVVGAWFMSAALIGVWLWQSGTVKKLFGIPFKWLAMAVVAEVFLNKSTAAISFFLVGVVIILISKYLRSILPLLAVILCIFIYLYNGATGTLAKEDIMSVVTSVVSADRAGSLEFRLNAEEILGDKARQKPLLGWGGNGRNRVTSADGRSPVTDSLWIIVFGMRGFVGLISLTTMFLLPAIVLIFYFPTEAWHHRQGAPVAALSLVLAFNMGDALLNAFPNPIFIIAAGAILGLFSELKEPKSSGVSLQTAERFITEQTTRRSQFFFSNRRK